MVDQGWRVLGASVQGASHRDASVPCQDAHRHRVLANGTLVVAVADGAGSADRSAAGAGLAVERAVAVLAEALAGSAPGDDDGWQALLRRTFAAARDGLTAFAAAEGIPLRSLATTLACVAVTDGYLAGGRLGDGAVVVEDPDGNLATVARPERGEYANETFFLTGSAELDHLETWAGPRPVRTLVVSTDGLLRLAFRLPTYEPHRPFFGPLLAFAVDATDPCAAETELAAFLASDRVNRRTDDDKTLVIAARTRPAAAVEVGAARGDDHESELSPGPADPSAAMSALSRATRRRGRLTAPAIPTAGRDRSQRRDQREESGMTDTQEGANGCQAGDRVVGSDGAEIGTVATVGADYLIVGAGRFLPDDYYVPREAIDDCRGGVVTLIVSREEALHMGWDRPPPGFGGDSPDTEH